MLMTAVKKLQKDHSPRAKNQKCNQGRVELITNRSTMRTWGLILSFIPFGWNAVFTCQLVIF